MRIYAISDLHIDYEENKKWLFNLSQSDYKNDMLILAGDITDITVMLTSAFEVLKKKFSEVFYVPGNHDLWVARNDGDCSLEKFHQLIDIAEENEIHTEPVSFEDITIVPLFGWYDYSFGSPSQELTKSWVDYSACKWPDDFTEEKLTKHFLALNTLPTNTVGQTIISFSHFLPRIDIMPSFIPVYRRIVYPVLGTSSLDLQIRELGSKIHIYGHTHVNWQSKIDGITYINNAYGYPHESVITRKELVCIHET